MLHAKPEPTTLSPTQCLDFSAAQALLPQAKMSEKEYTYQDVAEHNTKKDLFVVIHDKIYDCAKFVDEHP